MKVSPWHINLDSDLTLTTLDSKILVKIKKGIWIGVSTSTTLTYYIRNNIRHLAHKGSLQHQLLHFFFPSAMYKMAIINCNNYY